ncbi:3-methyladenine DNA glycosylase [Oerskovia douganii]|uniref:3-methyladenine DNA glycosylase n=1 Tax=Oerskovia douganii TaxID=2762210 RepID=UPI001D123DD3|nr:3-methyladenine DNA glycosylase [Oerskovia douganii]
MPTLPAPHPTSAPEARDAVGQEVLDAATWLPLAQAHASRADALTAGRRERKERGEKHAVEDFLFTYYPTRPAQLRRWHPGASVTLTSGGLPPDDVAPLLAERAIWRWHRTSTTGGVSLDVDAFLADRGETVRYARDLLAATASRPATLGCFGLHEWAMVYRDHAQGRDHRHPLPLRLGAQGTDEVVASHPVRCSHFDAFRFFTPEAVSLNRLQPTRETQPALEQPGCLHANMDLYKWATKLSPAAPGDMVLDAFELARDIRWVDMRASPYDVSAYGVAPVAIETPEGKAEYVRLQRGFAERSASLRARMLEVCERLLG